MNFIKFPDRGYSDRPLTYYKPLLETNDPVGKESELSDKLELWDLEPYQIKEQKPRWTWKIGENDKPIIQPCNRNWKLRLTIGGEVVKEDKIKYFDRNVEIDVGSFYTLNVSNICRSLNLIQRHSLLRRESLLAKIAEQPVLQLSQTIGYSYICKTGCDLI